MSQYVSQQWSNYQKICKGAHTIVNANEAMLRITGGSRTSESGDKFFPKFCYDFLRAFLKIFLHFPPKMFIYSPKISSFCQLRRRPWPDWPPPGSAQVGVPKAAPFGPVDFLQVGGPFREVGGPRPTLALW